MGVHFQVLEVLARTCTFWGGGPLPGPQGVSRYIRNRGPLAGRQDATWRCCRFGFLLLVSPVFLIGGSWGAVGGNKHLFVFVVHVFPLLLSGLDSERRFDSKRFTIVLTTPPSACALFC